MAALLLCGEVNEKTVQAKLEYMRSVLFSVSKIERFIGKTPDVNGFNPNAGWTYDSHLGWVLKNSIRYDGIDGSTTYCHYEQSGARKCLNFPDAVARLHTYGDSFTHCDQVNDGETWQEYLAAALGEPVENFGVGGYSVYQAYLRMKQVEQTHRAEYMILNIFDDDHLRNLEAWRNIRSPSAREGTLPYVRVNVQKDELTEFPNLCPTATDVYKLADLDWVMKTFGDDPILARMVALKTGEITSETLRGAALTFGLTLQQDRWPEFHARTGSHLHGRGDLLHSEDTSTGGCLRQTEWEETICDFVVRPAQRRALLAR